MTGPRRRKLIYPVLGATVFSLILVACLALPSWARFESPSVARSNSQEIEGLLAETRSEDWEARSRAFYSLMSLGLGMPAEGRTYLFPSALQSLFNEHRDLTDQIKLALIAVLGKENDVVEGYKRTGVHFGEDYSSYYGDVIAAVGSLKDKRAMESLLGAITTGGMATRALADMAPASLVPVLAKTADQDSHVRSFAIHVLREVLSRGPYSETPGYPERGKIKQALLRGAKDHEGFVRANAARALAALGDEDVIPLLKSMAESDPDNYPRDGQKFYYVRHAAKEALNELLAKKTGTN